MTSAQQSSSPLERYPSRGLSPSPSSGNKDESHDSSKPALPLEEDVMQLARLGQVGAIQKLFESGKADAHAKDEQGITPLHWAAYKNHYALCHFLIQSGADVNARGGDLNATPVLWAARNCHYYIVDLLLQHGADPLRTDDQGFNLIQNAALDGNVFQVVLILYHDVGVDTADPQGHTALMWAAYKGFPACVEVLLRLGANISATDEQGFTALHWALVRGSYGCIQKLIEYGADRFVTNNDGKTPGVVAEEMNTTRAWQKALDDCGYNNDATPYAFPLSSMIRDRGLFISRFLFLWPFAIIYCEVCILSGLPIYASIPFAVIAFAALQLLGQQLLQWAPPNMKKLDRTPFLAGIFAGTLFWVGLTWLFRILPRTFFLRPFSNLLFGILFSLCAYFYTETMNENPGYVPKNGSRTEQKAAIRDTIEAEAFNEAHFCIECMIRKPLRSKHCRRCGRCVAKHDHHCPWVHNCVANNNHRHFVFYILTMEAGIATVVSLAVAYIQSLPSTSISHCNILDDELCTTLNKDSFTIVLMIWAALQMIWVTMLIFVQLLQISRAQTTYENMRGHGTMSGPAEVATSAALAGAASLDQAELSERRSGLDASAQTQEPPPRKEGCFERWKKLLGVDAFMATAMQQTRGAEARARQRQNPFTRGILTNFKDFFFDPAPVFGRRENGSALLGGDEVNYTNMIDAPMRTSGRGGSLYTEINTADDNV